MAKIGLLAFLFVGIIVGGIAVQSGVLEQAPKSPDDLCNQHLDGGNWTANITESTSIEDGTKLHCEKDGGNTTENITVDIQVEVATG